MGQPEAGRPVAHATLRGTESRAPGAINAGPRAGSHRLGRHLRQLRERYGYSLRRVEQRARCLGEAIDNSQLSRFEKGKAQPSLDKLRALARIFDVPLQELVDLLELEAYESLIPELEECDALIAAGDRYAAAGRPGEACVAYERAARRADTVEQGTRATLRLAGSLERLGRIAWSERELRRLLRESRLSPSIRRQVLMRLAALYRDTGDHALAAVVVRDCLAGACGDDDASGRAAALAALGDLLLDEGDAASALAAYREALGERGPTGAESASALRVWINRGACLVSLARHQEALAVLRETHRAALALGDRYCAALTLTRMAEALRGIGADARARAALQESDGLASSGIDRGEELLFLNAYQRWRIARAEGNGAGEKWALDRLRSLRPGVRAWRRETSAYDHAARPGGQRRSAADGERRAVPAAGD